MAVSLPNGATIAVGSSYGASKALSAFSNANPGVMTLEASHGIVVNDIFEATSGWSRANGNVYRASVIATNDVTVEGLNTSSTTMFPAGSGTGTIREVSAWTQITQILETSTTGGEQQFVTYSFLEDDAEHQIPTVKSPISFKFKVGDDASLAHYAVLAAADADRQQRAVRVVLPSGSVIYWSAYITLQKTPSLAKNEVMGLEVTMSLINQVTRYTS
ncbi:phage tail protein [Variovorax paradoxus]|nr:phage tail protein [Variovorax paradoxus]